MKSIIKFTLILFLSVIISQISFSQSKYYSDPNYGPDSISRRKCVENLSIMGQFVKIKLYDEAYSGWSYVFHQCPASQKNVYIHGEKIIEHKINNASNEVEKNNWVDTLMVLYDQRIEYFGQNGYVRGKQGIDIMKYRPTDIKIAYGYLKESIDEDQARTKPAVIATYMQASYNLYRSNEIAGDEFISDYILCADVLSQGRQDSRTQKVTEAIEKLFSESGAADCETLISIFTPKLEEAPEDIDLIKKITDLLNEEECQTSDLYAVASEKQYLLEPTAEAAYNLARLFYTRDEFDKAIEYYKTAISTETEAEPLAKYNVELAQVLLNKKSDKEGARSYARAAISADPSTGDAYILIGNAYAASAQSCGESAFEKSAVYWAAVDKYQTAKAMDPSVSDKATELINRYKAYFPGKEEAFFMSLNDGDSYTVKCWINEKTTVRTK